jgi:hypothetical protein
MAENPDVQVQYTPLDLQLYNEKMVALFNAGTQRDAFYVRDTNLGAWVEAAGCSRSTACRPRRAQQGHLPVQPARRCIQGQAVRHAVLRRHLRLHLRRKALDKAGVKKAPVTLDQLKNAALEVKKAGIRSTRSSRATRPTSTGSTSCGRWSSPRAAICSTRT